MTGDANAFPLPNALLPGCNHVSHLRGAIPEPPLQEGILTFCHMVLGTRTSCVCRKYTNGARSTRSYDISFDHGNGAVWQSRKQASTRRTAFLPIICKSLPISTCLAPGNRVGLRARLSSTPCKKPCAASRHVRALVGCGGRGWAWSLYVREGDLMMMCYLDWRAVAEDSAVGLREKWNKPTRVTSRARARARVK